VKDKHVVKDAAVDVAQDVAEDVAQDVAKGVLGAAEDGNVMLFTVTRAIFQRRNPCPTHACRLPRCPWATREGRARKERGTGRGGWRCTAAAVFAQLALRWGRNLAAQWHLARALCGGAAKSASMFICLLKT